MEADAAGAETLAAIDAARLDTAPAAEAAAGMLLGSTLRMCGVDDGK